MPTFASFSDILPDPNNKINEAGATDSSGSVGPGFAKVKFTSTNQTQVARTISGRGVTASPSYHSWDFDISYNQLTRDEFDPVASFLESRRGRLKPFYVVLPQYSMPKDVNFALNTLTTTGVTPAGSNTILVSGVQFGEPSYGDFFNVIDEDDSNHKKTYKVIRVETSIVYQQGTTPPTTTQRRIWTQPPISRSISDGSLLSFIDPKFRVIQKGDIMEYELDTDNLYQFSLSLEEILP